MANEKPLETERPVFSWKAEEFAVYQKNPVWFAIVSLVAIGLIAFFIWTASWTAAGVVVAAVFAIFSSSRVIPKKVDCKLFREGVVIGEKAYRFADMKTFWLVNNNHPSIRFSRPGRFSTFVDMPIADEDPEQIRLFLSKYLPQEENRGEEVSDLLTRWLRF